MAPEDRKEMACPTSDEAQAKLDIKAEKELHELFMGWCRRNFVYFVHSRMDKKTTQKKGVPDFILLANGRSCAIEFKVHGNRLSDAQKSEMQLLEDCSVGRLVTDNYEQAVKFATFMLNVVEWVDPKTHDDSNH